MVEDTGRQAILSPVSSKPSRFLPGLRAILSIGRELRLLRHAVERLADAHEGKVAPPMDLPDSPEEPLAVAYTRDADYARQYQIELRLARQLGRTPTPDEIIRELDGEEQDPQDPVVVVGRRQPEREAAAQGATAVGREVH